MSPKRRSEDLGKARKSANQWLLDSADFTDLTVICGHEVFRVHKAIVCVCPFFASACSKGFKEAQTGVIEMSHDEPQVIQALLQYLYTGDYRRDPTCPSSLLLLAKIYASADMHDVPGLKDAITYDFDRSVGQGLRDESSRLDFVEAVSYIYENTLETDRALKDVAVNFTLRAAKELFETGVVAHCSRQVLRECPEYAVDLALATAGVQDHPKGWKDEKSVYISATQMPAYSPVQAPAYSVAWVPAYESSDEDGFI